MNIDPSRLMNLDEHVGWKGVARSPKAGMSARKRNQEIHCRSRQIDANAGFFTGLVVHDAPKVGSVKQRTLGAVAKAVCKICMSLWKLIWKSKLLNHFFCFGAFLEAEMSTSKSFLQN